jgi:hypothetical protein
MSLDATCPDDTCGVAYGLGLLALMGVILLEFALVVVIILAAVEFVFSSLTFALARRSRWGEP